MFPGGGENGSERRLKKFTELALLPNPQSTELVGSSSSLVVDANEGKRQRKRKRKRNEPRQRKRKSYEP